MLTVLGADITTDLVASGAGKSIAGLAVAAVLMLLGAWVRRFDKGTAETMQDLRDLNERLEAERDRAVAREETARQEIQSMRHTSDLQLARLRKERDQARQYARDLEYRLGQQHREWS